MTGELNLSPDRGPSIWARQSSTDSDDARTRRRTAVAGGIGLIALGSVLSAIGWRLLRQAAFGRADSATAASGRTLPFHRPRPIASREAPRDIVSEESAEGFPASDAPSWTPTTGV